MLKKLRSYKILRYLSYQIPALLAAFYGGIMFAEHRFWAAGLMVLGAFVSVRQLSWVIMFKDT